MISRRIHVENFNSQVDKMLFNYLAGVNVLFEQKVIFMAKRTYNCQSLQDVVSFFLSQY